MKIGQNPRENKLRSPLSAATTAVSHSTGGRTESRTGGHPDRRTSISFLPSYLPRSPDRPNPSFASERSPAYSRSLGGKSDRRREECKNLPRRERGREREGGLGKAIQRKRKREGGKGRRGGHLHQSSNLESVRGDKPDLGGPSREKDGKEEGVKVKKKIG